MSVSEQVQDQAADLIDDLITAVPVQLPESCTRIAHGAVKGEKGGFGIPPYIEIEPSKS